MDSLRRSVRLNQIKELFRGRRRAGFTTAELAEATGVSQRTVQRDLDVLQSEDGFLLNEKNGRYTMPVEERLGALELNLQEARAILIAARLFLRYSDESEPHAAEAIRKLARVMPEKVRPQIQAAADTLANRPLAASFIRNMTTVTDAWAKGRSLRMSYRSAGGKRAKDVIVDPYVLEPSAAGGGTYLIGYSRTHSQVRTFKIERIVSSEMLPQHFELPRDFDFDKLLSSAWGIIWGEGTQVRLKFSSDVAWRVRESRWHPSQAIEDLSDGSCILTISVASIMELGRWVRSWGDAVEVLQPTALRTELRREAEHLVAQYSRHAEKL
jgi:predicted DNA-binding transcriptional regulator YafY